MPLRVRAWGLRARLRRKAQPPPSKAEWQRRTEELIRAHAPGGSFADIGAMWQMHGRMPFVAEEAGATGVTAVDAMDPTPEFERERERRGSAVRFVQGDLHDPVTVREIGTHDFVWCSGVIYHSPNPYLLIEHLRRLTGRLLYLGTEIVPEIPGFDQACLFYPGLGERSRRAYGSVHGEGHGAIGVNSPFDATPGLGYANYWWGITPSALRAMVRTARFEIVEELHPDPFTMSVLARPVPGESVTPPVELARERGERRSGREAYPSPMATTPEQKPSIAPIVGPDDPRRFTDSGIEIQPLYTEEDVADGLAERLGEPGEYPFTRGIHREMYRSRRWTMRQYAGYASAKETNERFHYLIEHGSTGLSMAFDLPTQLGRDSDDPLCLGEVGRTGVAIDTIDDMRRVFDGIPLDEVSTSMTINAPAGPLLLLYELVGEEHGVDSHQLKGTTQNDILKEYIARGNFIYPPEPAMRLTTDLFAYCAERVPKWNTISISGYHMREKGCSAVQEVGFTLANAISYVEAAIEAGLEVDDFGPRLAFFFNGHNHVFQEIAKFRAVRRMWARIMRERFGSENPKSQMIRFHTQTGGVTLAAQQPECNIIRVALQGFAAVCGGTQSLHTNGFDEALALPSERAARIALRTQQILAYESGATDTVDPFAGSYFIEALTDQIERGAQGLIDKVDELGGSVHCIPFIRAEVEESAWGYEERYKRKQDIVVGVNDYVTEEVDEVEILRVDPESEREQVERLKQFKASRDQAAVDKRLEELRDACRGDANLLGPIRAALKDRASLGEVCGVMREEFGEYSEA